MAICQQLKGLFKSEFIQMKRNIILSLIEILCPVVLLLFFLILRLSFKKQKQKYTSIFENDLDFIANYSTNITNYITSKDQNPATQINENTPIPYYYFLAQCQYAQHIALIGKDFPKKLKNKISSHFWELDDAIDEGEFFKEFSSIEEFEKYMTSKKYGTDDILYPKICFGISQTDKFKFGIHYDTVNLDNDDSNNIANLLTLENPHIPEMKSNKNEKIRNQENLGYFKYYINSGYLMTMKIIYDYILQEITDDPNSEINFSVIGMKYDGILKDNFHKFIDLLGFFVVMSYSIPFSINIYKEIHFRETKKKEYLKSMGVKEIIFFMCSFIRCFIINIFQSIFCSLIVKLILKESQYIYLFLIFLLFGLVIFSMTYFFQSFLQESRLGVIISLLIYCIMSFFYLPLESPAANRGLAYFICMIFPPTNLLLGFDNFYIFEKEFSPLKNRVNLDISQTTISLMIGFFVVNFIIYLLLGFIVSQFFCYQYGINNNKICCSKFKGYYSLGNPPKDDKKNKNKGNGNIINNSFNQYNNINVNLHINLENNNLNNLGLNYDENDFNFSEKEEDDKYKNNLNNINNKIDFNNLDNEKLKQSIKNLGKDYIDSLKKKLPEKILEMKKKKLVKALAAIEEKSNSNTSHDDCEEDSDNQKETQEIKDRFRTSTFFNLKAENTLVKKNQNMNIDYMNRILGDPNLKQTICFIFDNNGTSNTRDKVERFHEASRLEIKNVKKIYDNEREYALKDLTFNLYENEIYALLGQNGAGKSTFISILSGLIEANNGSIRYKKDNNDKGLEVRDPEDSKEFRKILGVCHQNNNILYDDLTVMENLEIFCLLKYDKKSHGRDEDYYIRNEIETLIKKFELEEKRNELAKNLSGGLKRRLCIAIAFSGRSKVIILDEPTGGIDVLSRKKLWEILKNLKNEKKIILLITHFMDEASYLADEIGILKKGELMCSGTCTELIEKYGKFITIQINKRMDSNVRELLKFIKNNFVLNEPVMQNNEINNNIEEESNKEKPLFEIYKERIEVKIPTKLFNNTKPELLLKKIEAICGVNDYRILQDQLEDAFINAIKEESKKDNKSKFEELSQLDKSINSFSSFENFKNQLGILIFKRGYETKRDLKSIILEIIFPIILILIACFVSYFEALEDNRTVPIELNNFSNGKQTINYDFLNKTEFEKFYYTLINEGKKEKERIKDYDLNYLKNFLGQNDYSTLQNITAYLNSIYEFNKNRSITNNSACFYLIRADDYEHKYEFVSYISTIQRHSPIMYNNYLLNTVIRYEIKNGKKYKEYLDNVEITNSPFHLSYEEKNDKKSRNGFILAFYVSIALALIPANFITIIIREKENKSKHLQLLSGLSIYIYWINNYIFELIKYYFVVGICMIVLVIFKFYEKYLAIFYVLYGPALVSFTYVVSHFFDTEGVGQTIILLINLIFGALGGAAILILRVDKDMKKLGIALSYIFRFVPSFCISYGYSQLMSKKALFAVDYYKNIDDYEILKQKFDDPKAIIKDGKYVINDIIFLVIEIFLYTGLLIFLENKDYFLWKLGIEKYNPQTVFYRNQMLFPTEDNIVDSANTRRNPLKIKKDVKYPLEVINLNKSYKSKFNCCKKRMIKPVLSDVTFSVQDGECFGLLGSNGQGKTTSFKCLCKEIKPDNGIIKINNIDIFNYSVENKPNIGYCPQFDSIFEFLTVEENLQFYGRLKGISEYSLYNTIDFILEQLNLKKYSNKLSRDLSGGNKRKLSVGIALIIRPNVILLDEPSTGMDPYTRRLLIKFLYRAYLKKYPKEDRNKNPHSIVLTTHSIEEAESLCDKIGILVSGKFSVEGRICEILQTNSKGIELNVEFKRASPEDLKRKYGKILREKIASIRELKVFLNKIDKGNYFNYVHKDHFGRDIIKVLDKKPINKFSILRWVKYLDNLFPLVAEIKKYYNSVHCIKFKTNNFILKINSMDKNDNYIFAIIEKYKEILQIDEYSINLTTLESIFIDKNKKQNQTDLGVVAGDNNIKDILL